MGELIQMAFSVFGFGVLGGLFLAGLILPIWLVFKLMDM